MYYTHTNHLQIAALASEKKCPKSTHPIGDVHQFNLNSTKNIEKFLIGLKTAHDMWKLMKKAT